MLLPAHMMLQLPVVAMRRVSRQLLKPVTTCNINPASVKPHTTHDCTHLMHLSDVTLLPQSILLKFLVCG